METPSVVRKTNGQGPDDPRDVDGAVGGSEPYLNYSLFLPDPGTVEGSYLPSSTFLLQQSLMSFVPNFSNLRHN